MIALLTSFQLRCFQPNTTVMLDVQTRDAVFKAWPRTDATRETELCGKLKGDMFKLSIQTGAYEYVLNTLQSYDPAKYIEIRLPCTEVVLGVPGTCATAFKAKSAIYTMDFQEAKQNVTEAASNLRKLDFDRKACYQSPRMDVGQQVEISPGVFSDQFKFIASTANCKYPTDSAATIAANNQADKKANLIFFGYPEYNLVAKQYSVSAKDFIAKSKFSCVNMPSVGSKTWCTNMVTSLATQSFTYFQVNYSFPAVIPNRDGSLTRAEYYTTIMESNEVRNMKLSNFDCFENQNLRIFGKRNFRLMTTLNESMVTCNQPIKDLIDFDYMTTRIVFQENNDFRDGDVYQLDFKTSIQVLNVTNEWLPCSESLDEAKCYDILSKQSQLKAYKVIAQKIFYKNDQIINIMPLTVTHDFSCLTNMTYYMYDDQVCATFNQTCELDTPVGTAQFTFSFGDVGKYGNNLLNLTAQAVFPKSEHRYCVDHNFTKEQLTYYKNEDLSKKVSGALTIDSLLLPIPRIYDVSEYTNLDVKFILIGTAALVTLVLGLNLLNVNKKVQRKSGIKQKS
ncbi:Conserved_hypothetical protein [Hexamita inflata]|uniref:Uncharacterized protein n=1 Tax=Hexamita inflata TaxID=28002 RepID=A0AA86QET8_9EUKA|nr:Conserved hypothetical protein [Hexamita inflata]